MAPSQMEWDVKLSYKSIFGWKLSRQFVELQGCRTKKINYNQSMIIPEQNLIRDDLL